MKKIPTIEELMQEQFPDIEIRDFDKTVFTGKQVKIIAKTLAKLHKDAALEIALEEIPYGSSTDTVSFEDVKDILNCYPDENIK